MAEALILDREADQREEFVYEVTTPQEISVARHAILERVKQQGDFDEDRLYELELVISELCTNPSRHILPSEQAGFDPTQESGESIDALVVASPVTRGKVMIAVIDRHPESVPIVIRALSAEPSIEDILMNEGSAGLVAVAQVADWVEVHEVQDERGVPTAKCVTAEVTIDPAARIPRQVTPIAA